jgi:hypothetical protein
LTNLLADDDDDDDGFNKNNWEFFFASPRLMGAMKARAGHRRAPTRVESRRNSRDLAMISVFQKLFP